MRLEAHSLQLHLPTTYFVKKYFFFLGVLSFSGAIGKNVGEMPDSRF
ncbi:hypothetical protein C900_05072 [Fulvivirga imtechensis AK7]|uniref:Uncharacterized protein n=1 Tax=Fulvivirga imtechensis AK7 TaxID=1237149 RepID=L8JPT2_9BACT|nr:hypothetical protein C900_05072 [Fulvivirga imtechensis AK7]